MKITLTENNPLVFIDDDCPMCNRLAFFIINNTSKKKIYITSQKKICDFELNQYKDIDAIILKYKNKVFIKSKAVSQILKLLNWKFYPLSLFIDFIPLIISDSIYDWISKNRKKFFKNSNKYCSVVKNHDLFK